MTTSWRVHARESMMNVNDGIVSRAGIAEGFASAGVSTNTLLIAGVTTMLAVDARQPAPAIPRSAPNGR